MRTVTWTPDPDQVADPVVFRSDRGPWVLVDIDGHLENLATPSGVGAPRQMGVSASGVTVSPRVVTLTVGLIAETPEELVAMRRSLAHAMTDEPSIYGQAPRLGSLRYADADSGQFDIDGLPLGGLKLVSRDPTQTMEVYDADIWCPDPRWKAPADVQWDFTQTDPGGFTLPFELPFEIDAGVVSSVVVNDGTVSTPVIIRLHGEATNPRATLASTGEVLQIIGHIEADEYVEINTGFGTKSVVLVNETTGVETEALAMLDMSVSSFWSLRPGPQEVLYEADVQVDGFAIMFFRPRFMAV